jgi:acyl-CoA synthetase (AMP-forming)/AMP-acid ligase II
VDPRPRRHPGVRGRRRRRTLRRLDTGDVGGLDADGYLYLSGRGGDAINRGGEKIFPREIEEVLRRHPAVGDAVVVPRADPVLGEVPVAFVVRQPGPGGPDADELATALREMAQRELARPHRPVEYQVLETLPLGATGKVSRPALRELLAHRTAPERPEADERAGAAR